LNDLNDYAGISAFDSVYIPTNNVTWQSKNYMSRKIVDVSVAITLSMCLSRNIVDVLVTYHCWYVCHIRRRVWRYQRGNQNPYIKEEQTTQWSKEKVQKDKQRSTKLTHKTKDWVTRTPLKTRGELRCSGRVSSSCSTSGTIHVNLVTNHVISHEWGKDQEVFMTSGTYPW